MGWSIASASRHVLIDKGPMGTIAPLESAARLYVFELTNVRSCCR